MLIKRDKFQPVVDRKSYEWREVGFNFYNALRIRISSLWFSLVAGVRKCTPNSV